MASTLIAGTAAAASGPIQGMISALGARKQRQAAEAAAALNRQLGADFRNDANLTAEQNEQYLRMGINAAGDTVRDTRNRALGRIDQATSDAGNVLGQGEAQALGLLGQGQNRAHQALGRTLGQAGGTLGQIAGTQPINVYDALGNLPNRLGSRVDAGLGSGFEADPGYRFRQEEGMRALDNQASAAGGRLSGRAIKEAQRFSQGLASQEYGNYFGRQAQEAGLAGQSDTLGLNALLNQAGRSDTAGLTGQQIQTNALGQLANLQSGIGQQQANNMFQRGVLGSGVTQNTANQYAGILGSMGQTGAGLESTLGTALANTLFSGQQALVDNNNNRLSNNFNALGIQTDSNMAPVRYTGQGADAVASGLGAGVSNGLTAAYLYGNLGNGGK